MNRLYTVEQLTSVIATQEQRQAEAEKALERLEEQKTSFAAQGGDSRLDTEQTEAKIRFMQEQLDTLVREWKDNYESYYNVDQEYEVLTISDEDLRARFRTMVDENRGDMRAPLTDDTLHLIGEKELSQMKESAILINVGRGPIIVEKDLADALNSGKVYAAGLDVVSTEPVKGDNPLLKAKNCIITPHISWAPKEARQRIMDMSV